MRKIILGTAIAMMSFAASAQASLLGLDFGGAAETGFTSVTSTSATVSGTAISITNPTGGAINFRDRGVVVDAGASTFNDLYDDFVRGDVTAAGQVGLRITLTGGQIAANTQYFVTAYGFDIVGNGGSNSAVNVQDYRPAASSTTLASVTYTGVSQGDSAALAANQPTSNDQYARTFTLTSNASGAISFDVVHISSVNSAAGGPAYRAALVNGLQVAAVPEPATIGLLSIAGLAALRRRRA